MSTTVENERARGDFPFVSVIVLTRNRVRLLAQCLDSLCRQDYPEDRLELVVVDDGSTDRTPEYMRNLAGHGPRIRYMGGEHQGIPATRNRGIRVARGEILAIVADDYRLSPNYIRTIVSFFADRPDAAVVRFRIVPARDDLSSRLIHFVYEISLRKRLDPEPGPAPSGLMNKIRFSFRPSPLPPLEITADHQLEAAGGAAYRREVFSKVRLFDESLRRAEDSDMGRRLREQGLPVYFDPFHTIAHQYGPWTQEVLVKNFRAGIYHQRLARRRLAKPGLVGSGKSRLLHMLRRAIQMEGLPTTLLYLPSVLLAELARRIGMVYGRLRLSA